MFELFTDRARRVVVLAQEEARLLDHNYIGTEHILLGLVHEGEGVAARVLGGLGIELEAVRQQVEQIIGRGTRAPAGHIPFTPRAKKILELSLRESKQLGHGYIGTEHILLGLVREGEGVAAQVLYKLGADLTRVRRQVIQELSSAPGPVADDIATTLRRARSRLSGGIPVRIPAIEGRLAAVERWVGISPDLAEDDQEIERVRREKDSAIDAQDFEGAARLRDRERELSLRRLETEAAWKAAIADRKSLSRQVSELAAEVERLTGLLREHGIEPGNGAA